VDSTTRSDARAHAGLPDRARGKASTCLRQLRTLVFGWYLRLRDRRDLTKLSNYLLDDIGIRRDDIEREPSRSFWRVDR
jgi:uncharacterized protein YjiS (DUF1127 family)